MATSKQATNEEPMTTSPSVSWAALAVGLLSLFLSIAALSQASKAQPSENPPNTLQVQVRSLQQKYETNKASQQLQDIREKVATGSFESSDIQHQVEDVRDSLKKSFENAGQEPKQSWRTVDTQLGDLLKNLQEGGANTLDNFDKVLAYLKQSIKYD